MKNPELPPSTAPASERPLRPFGNKEFRALIYALVLGGASVNLAVKASAPYPTLSERNPFCQNENPQNPNQAFVFNQGNLVDIVGSSDKGVRHFIQGLSVTTLPPCDKTKLELPQSYGLLKEQIWKLIRF